MSFFMWVKKYPTTLELTQFEYCLSYFYEYNGFVGKIIYKLRV